MPDDTDLIAQYNYDAFVPEKFGQWMRFHKSPAVGAKGPDFPLWDVSGKASTLHDILRQHTYTIVEFGSFT